MAEAASVNKPNKSAGKNMGVYRAWRRDFPIFAKKIGGKDFAFLDTASSSQKPRVVLDAMRHSMEDHYANIHRGLYAYSHQTTNDFEAARKKVADFIVADSDKEIVFTRNSTEAINLVAQSWGRAFLERGDEVILTEMEHHANIVPWQILQDQIGIVLKFIKINKDGTLDLDHFESLLNERTKFVSVVHVSNSLGTVNDVKQITHIAKDFYSQIKVLVDGSQAVVHSAVNVKDIGCDFYAFTGHKLYGPTGIGVLWGDYATLESMPPYQGGGDMIEIVSYTESLFKSAPARFEAGTPAFVEAAGLGVAIDFVSDIGLSNIHAREQDLLRYANEKLQEVDGLNFFGEAPKKAGIISFTADWGHPSDVSMILDQCGVAVRAGHHCCMPLMDILGVDATIRASFGLYTMEEDVDALVDGLHKAKEMLG